MSQSKSEPRDYSKYSVEGLGSSLNKRKLALAIVKDYIQNKSFSYLEALDVFPDKIQGGAGVVRRADDPLLNPKYYFTKEPINCSDCQIVVCSQWGTKNIEQFISAANKIGYNIQLEEVDSTGDRINEIDFQIWGENTNFEDGNVICTVEGFQIDLNGLDHESSANLQNALNALEICTYDNLIDATNLLVDNLTKEIYLAAIQSVGKSSSKHALEALFEEDYDWYGRTPYIFVSRINDIDLSWIMQVDRGDHENPEMLQRAEECLDEELDLDIEDWVSDYLSQTRHSIDQELFLSIHHEGQFYFLYQRAQSYVLHPMVDSCVKSVIKKLDSVLVFYHRNGLIKHIDLEAETANTS